MPLVATLCQLVLQIAIKWVVRPAPPGVSVRLEDSFPLPVFRLVQKEHWISKLQKDRFSFQWIHGRLWNFPNSQDTQGKQFFWQIFFFVLFRSINSWTLKSKSLQPVVSRFEFFFFFWVPWQLHWPIARPPILSANTATWHTQKIGWKISTFNFTFESKKKIPDLTLSMRQEAIRRYL